MQDLPKIVRERLGTTGSELNHPDADVLNAFAERSLSDRERASVFDHLASCHDCRDIVALALPESEAGQFVARPARGRWLAWPGLRWGLAAAAIVVVASIGALQYQRQARSRVVVARDFERPAVSSDSQARSASSATIAEPKEKGLSHKGAAAPATSNTMSSAKTETAAGNGSLQEQHRQSELRASTTPAASALHPSIMGAPISGRTTRQQAEDAANTLAQNRTPLSSQPSAHLFDEGSSHEIVRAKDAVPAAGVANVPANGRNFAEFVSLAPGTSPGWAINSAGGLQRSYDQGATWQDVNVTANLTPSGANGYSFGANAAQTTRAAQSAANSEELDKKIAAKTPVSSATPVAAPVFRAVAATGADVWAGGSGGALYHSLDAGNHWTQVLPAAAGASLTGDVIGLEFPDTLNGTVTTSTAETWITADAGQTWQKQ